MEEVPISISYNENIPDGNNKPSQDRKKMTENTNSISKWVEVDHVGFNTANGGRHKQVSFLANLAADPSVIGSGTLFTKDPNSNLFFKSITGVLTQMTGSVTQVGTNFGVKLPFGVIVNWGFVTATYPVTITLAVQNSNALGSVVVTSTTSNSFFGAPTGDFASPSTIILSGSPGSKLFYITIGT